MTTQHDDRAELVYRVAELTKRFSEGWHDGIKIDASDIATLSEAAALLQADAQAGGEAMAWLYTLEYGNTIADTKVSIHQLNYPFGVVGADYLRENQQGVSYVRETKLYKRVKK